MSTALSTTSQHPSSSNNNSNTIINSNIITSHQQQQQQQTQQQQLQQQIQSQLNTINDLKKQLEVQRIAKEMTESKNLRMDEELREMKDKCKLLEERNIK